MAGFVPDEEKETNGGKLIAGTIGLRGGLGDFVTRGALEEHLAPDFAQNRSRETREWLESLG